MTKPAEATPPAAPENPPSVSNLDEDIVLIAALYMLEISDHEAQSPGLKRA